MAESIAAVLRSSCWSHMNQPLSSTCPTRPQFPLLHAFRKKVVHRRQTCTFLGRSTPRSLMFLNARTRFALPHWTGTLAHPAALLACVAARCSASRNLATPTGRKQPCEGARPAPDMARLHAPCAFGRRAPERTRHELGRGVDTAVKAVEKTCCRQTPRQTRSCLHVRNHARLSQAGPAVRTEAWCGATVRPRAICAG